VFSGKQAAATVVGTLRGVVDHSFDLHELQLNIERKKPMKS
jgi:hypothetical protein